MRVTRDELLVDVRDRVATLTLNRPSVRNALNTGLISVLAGQMAAAEADDEVDVIILTGADPAFCAGLDLRELGDTGANLGVEPVADGWNTPWPAIGKPVIGAINGAAVTGGLELALHCDIRLASERAVFADTHARVGVVPAWGMTVLLPAAVGTQRARFLSLTGAFLTADAARDAGLVLEVLPHDALLSRTRAVAGAMVECDQHALREILAVQRAVSATTQDAGFTPGVGRERGAPKGCFRSRYRGRTPGRRDGSRTGQHSRLTVGSPGAGRDRPLEDDVRAAAEHRLWASSLKFRRNR